MLTADRGEQAYLLDPYLFSVRLARDPHALDRLLADLASRRFGAVILDHASADLPGSALFEADGTGRFRDALTHTYGLAAIVEGRAIYRPRPEPTR
jgi:hypothetical protein